MAALSEGVEIHASLVARINELALEVSRKSGDHAARVLEVRREAGNAVAAAENHFANRLAELAARIAEAEKEIAELRRSRTKPRRPPLNVVSA